jgi:hypothetical protein
MEQTKICSCCKIEKSLNDYYEVKRKTPLVRNIKTDNRKAMCKQCYTARAKKWSIDNKEKRKEIAKRYDSKNVEIRKKKSAEYRKRPEVKDRMNDWARANSVRYLRERRQSDPLFAFKIKTRNLIRKAFDRNGFTKRSKSNDILGCSWSEFISHMEKQFKEGMTWQNRGEWHIDHIIPLATATCEDDIIRLNHFTNLRPLWAEENLRKSDKLEFIL